MEKIILGLIILAFIVFFIVKSFKDKDNCNMKGNAKKI